MLKLLNKYVSVFYDLKNNILRRAYMCIYGDNTHYTDKQIWGERATLTDACRRDKWLLPNPLLIAYVESPNHPAPFFREA